MKTTALSRSQCLSFTLSELPSLIKNPLFQVLAFIIVASLLPLFGEGLGFGHRSPGCIEVLLIFAFFQGRKLKDCAISGFFLFHGPPLHLKVLPVGFAHYQ